MNPLTWIRKWAESAVLAGVADACDRLAVGADGDAARRLAALAAPPAAGLPAAANGQVGPAAKAERGGRGK